MKSREGWVWLLLVVTFQALLAGPLSQSASAAETPCVQGLVFKFDGTYYEGDAQNPVALRGAAASIEAKKANLCDENFTIDSRTSSSWAMLATGIGDTACGGQQYAQIGYAHRIHTDDVKVFRFFWQWTRKSPDCSPATRFWSNGTDGPFAGTTYDFKVSRYLSDDHLHMLINDGAIDTPCNVDGTCAETNYDPLGSGGWQEPFQAQFLEEIHSLELDYAGTNAGRVDYTDVRERVSGDWIHMAYRVCDPGCHETPHWLWVFKSNLFLNTTCWASMNHTSNDQSWEVWSQPTDHDAC